MSTIKRKKWIGHYIISLIKEIKDAEIIDEKEEKVDKKSSKKDN